MHVNWFRRLLENPTFIPHRINVEWPLSVGVAAILEAYRKNPLKHTQVPTFTYMLLTTEELKHVAQAIDQALVD